MSPGLAYRDFLMGLLVGRCLPGKFDIFLNALAVDVVDALLAGRSHVEQPGFSDSQGRVAEMEWDPDGSRKLGATSSFINTKWLSGPTDLRAHRMSELQH